jgi:hypothetical protein
MFVLNESLGPKKRRRDSFESLLEDSPEDSPSGKREKATSEARVVHGHRTPGYWNRLSKVRLTRGALREFDRRTSRPEPRLLTSRSNADASPELGTKGLEQFSRKGGPDLAHIRGVSSVHESAWVRP